MAVLPIPADLGDLPEGYKVKQRVGRTHKRLDSCAGNELPTITSIHPLVSRATPGVHTIQYNRFGQLDLELEDEIRKWMYTTKAKYLIFKDITEWSNEVIIKRCKKILNHGCYRYRVTDADSGIVLKRR